MSDNLVCWKKLPTLKNVRPWGHLQFQNCIIWKCSSEQINIISFKNIQKWNIVTLHCDNCLYVMKNFKKWTKKGSRKVKKLNDEKERGGIYPPLHTHTRKNKIGKNHKKERKTEKKKERRNKAVLSKMRTNKERQKQLKWKEKRSEILWKKREWEKKGSRDILHREFEKNKRSKKKKKKKVN